MGVLACDRKGCENVMCNRFSYKHRAYLCDDCFNELVALGPITYIHEFLDTPANKSKLDLKASYAFFNAIFTLDDE